MLCFKVAITLLGLLCLGNAFIQKSQRAFRPQTKSRAQKANLVMVDPSEIHIMMNGLPGAMGREVAGACIRRGFKIAPYAFTGPDVTEALIDIDDLEGGEKIGVKLIRGPTDEKKEYACDGIIDGLKAACGDYLIAIDYTHPTAVNCNANFYAKHQLNFVMGTTGGDRAALQAVTEGGGHYAIVAPNMAKGIVALQAGLDDMARAYPGAFNGYKLTIDESHQSTKADTSGTAKAIAGSLATLNGAPFDLEDINMIRDPEGQRAFGVPEEDLKGHAYHTYALVSPDGTTEFQFRHNVNGRRVYAEGTADAVQFLAEQIKAKNDKKVFSMIDVLKAGALKDQ